MITSYQLPYGKTFTIRFKKKNEKFNIEEGTSLNVEIDQFKFGEWGQVYSILSQPLFHTHIKSEEDFNERFELTHFESNQKMWPFENYNEVIEKHRNLLK